MPEAMLNYMEERRYLNLGSGQRPFAPPWINWDIQVSKWQKPTEDAGCIWQAPWELGRKYDIICLHHVIEHFGCGEADGIIQQCYDYLAEDGSLLVMVPDLRALAKRWLLGQLDTQLYVTQLYGAYMGDEADRHKWGWDFDALYAYLRGFPFSVVTAFNKREIPGAAIAHDWYILEMECVK